MKKFVFDQSGMFASNTLGDTIENLEHRYSGYFSLEHAQIVLGSVCPGVYEHI